MSDGGPTVTPTLASKGDPFGVPDYLQLASFNRRSLSLDVRLLDGREGRIEVVDGEAWNARLGPQIGVNALTILVSEPVASVSVRELGQRPSLRAIELPTHALLLDLARIQDEARRAESADVSGVFARPSNWDAEDDDPASALDLPADAVPLERLEPHAALRQLLNAVVQPHAEIDARCWSALPARLHQRHWPHAPELRLADAMREEVDVVLVGFAPTLADALLQRLREFGVLAKVMSADELLEARVHPDLLVQRLEVEDADPPFACFDLAWTLRLAGRACPWMVVTDWPTRYTEPLCRALGACAWHDLDFADTSGLELAPAIIGWLHSQRCAAMPSDLRALDLVLMVIDSELDATVELRVDDRVARIAIVDGELSAAEFDAPDHGPRLRGIDAAAAACLVEQPALTLLPPIPTREHNLPRGLALALAALTRGLLGVPNSTIGAAQESNMSSLNHVCSEIVTEIPDALACGIVDLNTGMLMGIHHTISYFTQSYLDAVAAAAVDMFRGKNVQRIEKLMSKHRGEEIRDSFEEIFISSHSVFHFMKLIADKSAVVVLVTRKSTNQGMGWSALRIAVEDIRAALP